MRRHDSRPGDAGGFSDEPQHGSDPAYGTTSRGATSAGGRPPFGDRAFRSSRSSGYTNDDEPGYTDTAATSVVEPPSAERSDDFYDVLGDDGPRISWNGGTDLGLLIVRWALGATFLAHGAQKLGFLPGMGPEAVSQMLQEKGFSESATLALVTGGTELGAGALLLLGLFTPVAAAGIVGLMASMLATTIPAPYFAADGGFEFELMLGATALGLLFTGPGRAALDNGRWWFRRPLLSGTIGLVVAAIASTTVLLVFR